MTRPISPATPKAVTALRNAILHLKIARAELVRANCPKTLRRVRLCLTSAQGAGRHIDHRLSRTNGDGTTWNYTDRPKPKRS